MIATVAQRHPKLAYAFFAEHAAVVYSTLTLQSRLFLAQALPEIFADAAPLDDVAATAKRLSPAGSDVYIARGVARAQFDLLLKGRLDDQADAALANLAAAR
jgi:hypothetical protein